MARLIYNLWGLVIHPVKTMRMLLLGKPFWLAQVVVLGVFISLFSAQFILNFDAFHAQPSSFFSLIPLEIVSLVVTIFTLSAIWHLTADMLGGAGRGLNLLLLIVISMLPMWLVGIFSFLFILISDIPLMYQISVGAVSIWSVILMIVSMRELYRFSHGRAVFTFMLPIIIMVGITLYMLPVLGDGISLLSQHL